ncbi:MAG: hypothetical protein ACI4XR_02465 [Bacilli bacterium]
MNIAFDEYMHSFPGKENGLWSIVEEIMQEKMNIANLREKYKNTKRKYICNKEI